MALPLPLPPPSKTDASLVRRSPKFCASSAAFALNSSRAKAIHSFHLGTLLGSGRRELGELVGERPLSASLH